MMRLQKDRISTKFADLLPDQTHLNDRDELLITILNSEVY